MSWWRLWRHGHEWGWVLARWCMVNDDWLDWCCFPDCASTPLLFANLARWLSPWFRFLLFDTCVCVLVGYLIVYTLSSLLSTSATWLLICLIWRSIKHTWSCDLTLGQCLLACRACSSLTRSRSICVCVFICCWCWKLLWRCLWCETNMLGSDGGSSACGCIWDDILFAWVEAWLAVQLTDVSEQNIWFKCVSDETGDERHNNCSNRHE